MSFEPTPPANGSSKNLVTQLLNVIEWLGNKLPDPAVLAQVTFLTRMVTNFTGFAPLGIVLVALLGVGVAEHTGFINAIIKAMLGVTPAKLLTPMLLVVAIISHTAGDTGYVLVIPLGGIIFAVAGRHPLAGIVCAFAGVSGGFSANFLISGLDPLLQGFTQSAAQLIEPDRSVNPLCNYIFMAASSALIVAVGWFLTDRVIEPKLRGTPIDGKPEDMPVMEPLTAAERRGMIAGLITFGLLAVLLMAACIPEDSPFRFHVENLPPAQRTEKELAKDKSLIVFEAPLMRSIVPLIFLMFIVPGIVHGYVAGTWAITW
jgi:aminobenzoyl-glutamate transport protein